LPLDRVGKRPGGGRRPPAAVDPRIAPVGDPT
jgi:hypothetical protein